MTKDYSATVEVAGKIEGVDLDELVDQLEPHHGTVGESARGYPFAMITLPANSLQQASASAATIVSTAFGREALVIVAMTTEEFDRREDWAEVPELVGVTEAAEILGVTRQRIQERISDGSIQATKVGKGWAIVKSTLRSRPPGRPAKKRSAAATS